VELADSRLRCASREVARSAVAELSPVCAVLGGILGQEVLKAISRKGELACNCFVFDGSTSEGRVLRVPKA
jgi:ubiquitin-like 1-activating enzyme E1 A